MCRETTKAESNVRLPLSLPLSPSLSRPLSLSLSPTLTNTQVQLFPTKKRNLKKRNESQNNISTLSPCLLAWKDFCCEISIWKFNYQRTSGLNPSCSARWEMIQIPLQLLQPDSFTDQLKLAAGEEKMLGLNIVLSFCGDFGQFCKREPCSSAEPCR